MAHGFTRRALGLLPVRTRFAAAPSFAVAASSGDCRYGATAAKHRGQHLDWERHRFPAASTERSAAPRRSVASALPRYVPRRQLSGTLRVWGLSYLQDGPREVLGRRVQEVRAGVEDRDHLPTGAIAVAALATGVADIGVNYKATLTDRLDFEQVFTIPSPRSPWPPAPMMYTDGIGRNDRHQQGQSTDAVSVKQLDGVFGTARNGGYQGAVWPPSIPILAVPGTTSGRGISSA